MVDSYFNNWNRDHYNVSRVFDDDRCEVEEEPDVKGDFRDIAYNSWVTEDNWEYTPGKFFLVDYGCVAMVDTVQLKNVRGQSFLK